MAVAPSHRIHTIHGAFGGPTYASVVPSVPSAQASSFNSLPNISYSRRSNLSILASRAAPSSGPHSSLFTPRSRRSSVVQVPSSARRAPPPPRTIVIPPAEDPFADNIVTEPIVVALPPPRRFARSQSSPSSISSFPPPPSSFERRAAKLVANVLLSRGCGRPMRRRPSYGEAKTYVKSGLSQVVSVEC